MTPVQAPSSHRPARHAEDGSGSANAGNEDILQVICTAKALCWSLRLCPGARATAAQCAVRAGKSEPDARGSCLVAVSPPPLLPVASGGRRDETAAFLPRGQGPSAVGLQESSRGRVDQLAGGRPPHRGPPLGRRVPNEMQRGAPGPPEAVDCARSWARPAPAGEPHGELGHGLGHWGKSLPSLPPFSCQHAGNHHLLCSRSPPAPERPTTHVPTRRNVRWGSERSSVPGVTVAWCHIPTERPTHGALCEPRKLPELSLPVQSQVWAHRGSSAPALPGPPWVPACNCGGSLGTAPRLSGE